VQAVPDINLILTKLNEIPCVENQEKSIRLIFNRSRAVFRTLFFVLIFGISVLALLHLIKDWGAKSSFFSAIFLFMGCVAAGCATFLSASASLYPQYIEITTHGITEKNKNILLTYSWTELGNPRIVVKNRGNHYIVFDNTKIQLLPEEFCCRESELLGIINTTIGSANRPLTMAEGTPPRALDPNFHGSSCLLGLAFMEIWNNVLAP
jgi:hypothetical protein